ncbi:MAG: hypothetical protein JWR42_2668 [Marmoricola sp.]|nr:hypothetical protein [Marmoricola sp.]
MSSAPNEIAAALNQVAREAGSRSGLGDVLSTLTLGAVEAFPDIEYAGISITHRGGRIETLAATDNLVLELDDLQYQHHEGPCYDSITDQPVVLTEYARHEQRWPHYIPAAIKLGLRSQLGLRLYTDDRTMGGLNLYSTSTDTISDDTVMLAEVFATYATAALQRARTEEDMASALSTRQLIGQATGITMERYGLDETKAFAYLLRASSTTNVKLRDLARTLVDGAGDAS